MSHSEALAYWKEEQKKDPDAFLRVVMKAVGFTDEEIEGTVRERVLLEDAMCERARRFRYAQEKRLRKMDQELTRAGIIVKQQFIEVMKRAGKTDEEVNESLAAMEDVRRNRCTIQDQGSLEERLLILTLNGFRFAD